MRLLFLSVPPAIHKDGGGLRWQPLHDARHMVPAFVGDTDFGKGTAPPAPVCELQSGSALVNEDQIAERLMPALVHDTGRTNALLGADPKLDGEVVFAHVQARRRGGDFEVLVDAVEAERGANQARHALGTVFARLSKH